MPILKKLLPALFLSCLSAAAYAAPKLPLPKKQWTVMIYANAKNNLASPARNNFEQIKKIGSSAGVNIVMELGAAQLDEQKNPQSYDAVKTFYFDAPGSAVELQNLGKADMGDWKELVRFVRSAKVNFPAEKYMLVLWSHGDGWKFIENSKPIQGSAPAGKSRAISYDEESGNYITTLEQRAALKAIGGIDLLAYNSCLMSDIGITAETAQYVKYIAGSEDYFYSSSYPLYEKFLTALNSDPAMTPRDAGVLFENSYWGLLTAMKNLNGTASVVDTAQIAPLVNSLKRFASRALVSPDRAALTKAFVNAHRLGGYEKGDLYDFLRLTDEYSSDAALKTCAQQAMAALQAAVVLNLDSGTNQGKTHGISGYFPNN